MKQTLLLCFFAGLFVCSCSNVDVGRSPSKQSILEVQSIVKAEKIKVVKSTHVPEAQVVNRKTERAVSKAIHPTSPAGIVVPAELISLPMTPNLEIDFPDINAEFCGGSSALHDYIRETIEYPAYELLHEIQGRVYVAFVVEPDGSISDVEVIKHVSPGLDEEALRVIRSFPNWIPAQRLGKFVKARFRVPITFKII